MIKNISFGYYFYYAILGFEVVLVDRNLYIYKSIVWEYRSNFMHGKSGELYRTLEYWEEKSA